MAYLRKENETVEMDYSLNKVWKAIKRVLVSLSMREKMIDESTHHVKAKTKGGLLTLSSLLLIDVTVIDDNSTRVSVAAETPVTTITAMIDFGQAKQQINLFLMELAKQLDNNCV